MAPKVKNNLRPWAQFVTALPTIHHDVHENVVQYSLNMLLVFLGHAQSLYHNTFNICTKK